MDGKNLRSAFTSFVEAGTLDTFDPTGCPTLLQRAIESSAIWRIVMVGGNAMGFRFHGEELNEVADSRPVERTLDGAYQTVPAAVAANLAAMCSALSIEFASADFVEDALGRLWFLDLNPEGQWAFLEDRFGVRISDVIVGLARAA